MFGLAACSDLHVVLSSKVRVLEGAVDIIIGGWDNTRSIIRAGVGGGGWPIYSDVSTPNILSCSETRYFWVTWHNSLVAVGRGEVLQQDILRDARPVLSNDINEITAVGYSTGWGYNGTWYIKTSPAMFPPSPDVTALPPETSTPPPRETSPMSQDTVAGVILGVIAVILVVGISLVYSRSRGPGPAGTTDERNSSEGRNSETKPGPSGSVNQGGGAQNDA